MIIIDKIKIEVWQEADNEVGSESMTIELCPALIGMYKDNGEVDYYIKMTSEYGFSFEDKTELMQLIDKVERIALEAK